MKSGCVMSFATQPVTQADRVGMWLVLGFFVALGLAVATVPFWWPIPLRSESSTSCWVSGLLAIMLLLYLAVRYTRDSPRGTYCISRVGLEFHPERGKTRSLRWEEIERVHWPFSRHPRGTFYGIALRGLGTTIKIPLDLIGQPAKSEAMRHLRTILSPDFDLTWKPYPSPLRDIEPQWYAWVHRLARVAAVALVAVALMIATLWFSEGWLWVWFYGWVGLLVAVYFKMLRDLERINPTWRVRRNKKPSADP